MAHVPRMVRCTTSAEAAGSAAASLTVAATVSDSESNIGRFPPPQLLHPTVVAQAVWSAATASYLATEGNRGIRAEWRTMQCQADPQTPVVEPPFRTLP